MVNLNLMLAPFHLLLSQVVSVGGEPVGALDVGDVSLRIDGGRAYVEKDWGSKFPKTHVWVQAELRGTYPIAFSGGLQPAAWRTRYTYKQHFFS